jgi:hypothetical protein
MRQGDTVRALIKSIWADALDDCLDLTKIELDQAEWTMSHTEDELVRALREERQYMGRPQGGR